MIAMVAALLAATAVILDIIWMGNMRDDGATPSLVAEQQGE